MYKWIIITKKLKNKKSTLQKNLGGSKFPREFREEKKSISLLTFKAASWCIFFRFSCFLSFFAGSVKTGWKSNYIAKGCNADSFGGVAAIFHQAGLTAAADSAQCCWQAWHPHLKFLWWLQFVNYFYVYYPISKSKMKK